MLAGSGDPYLVERITPKENEKIELFCEVDGKCPLCGKYLMKKSKTNMTKLFEIAHIYPNSPTPHQISELKDVERLGINCEDSANKIVLCREHHKEYDYQTTVEEYEKVLKIKKNLIATSEAKKRISTHDIECEINSVLERLTKLDSTILKEINLKYQSVEVKNKINSNFMLQKKVEDYVCHYFYFIRETFKDLEQPKKKKFKIIAQEVKTVFFICSEDIEDQSTVFNSMVSWLSSKTDNSSVEACEAVISFFIQNCEVFDEVTE